MGKSYSGLFPTTSGGRAATATPATSGKMAGIKVSLPIGTYDTGIKIHKQNEHIPGTKEFKPGKSEIQGKRIIDSAMHKADIFRFLNRVSVCCLL